jgi:hypothetical protein
MPTPTQELISKDLHGSEWRFKHIYRGMQISVFFQLSTELFSGHLNTEIRTIIALALRAFCSELMQFLGFLGQPRRHLLTTGWSTFVTSKKLVAGDAFVYLRLDYNPN